MAERRMFARSVVESGKFLKMPASSQLLYFHLGMNADDDGVVEAYTVLNQTKAHEDDLRVLRGKGFIEILNEDLVSYIPDWRKQNKIRADRKKDSIYKDLLLDVIPEVDLLEKKSRSDKANRDGPSMDGRLSAQCSVGKYSTGKDSIGQVSVADGTHTPLFRLKDEVLTSGEYNQLVSSYSKDVADKVIQRILDKPYHGCLNTNTISKWCKERMTPSGVMTEGIIVDQKRTDQLEALARERG